MGDGVWETEYKQRLGTLLYCVAFYHISIFDDMENGIEMSHVKRIYGANGVL